MEETQPSTTNPINSPDQQNLPQDLPQGVQKTNFLGVDYYHFQTVDGGDMYLTEFGIHFWRQMLPENWYAKEWFKENRVRLDGTSTVYRVRTREVEETSIDLVVKFSRVGEMVPLDTFTVTKFIDAEFNSPFEEFSILMELRRGEHGPPGIRIRTQHPLAIYVPTKTLQPWQTGRSEDKIRNILERHPGVEIDIMRQYVVVFGWIKGMDAVETAYHMGLSKSARQRFLSHVNGIVVHELAQKGYRVVDMKPQHVILRPLADGSLLRDHTHQYAYALIDYELLQRTSRHEAEVRREMRKYYFTHMAHRFDEEYETPVPDHLHREEILGVPYVGGRTESTGGYLWVVGKDPGLFPYFLPERWRRTPRRKLAGEHRVYYTCTKDDINLVWRESRVGDPALKGDSDQRRQAVTEFGYNGPFESVALTLELAEAGIKCIQPRAVYMTGSDRPRATAAQDQRRHEALSHIRTPEGQPVLRPDRDYITVYGFWNGTSDLASAMSGHTRHAVDGEKAVAEGLVKAGVVDTLLEDIRRRLVSLSMEALDLHPDHLLLAFDENDQLVIKEDGQPETRLCNVVLIRRTGAEKPTA